MNAPRNELFAGLRCWTPEGFVTSIGTDLAAPPGIVLCDFANRLGGRQVVWTGTGAAALACEIDRVFGGKPSVLELGVPLSVGVARVARKIAESGSIEGVIQPNYIRPAEAEVRKTDAQV